ncbi:MAG: hypothetical protein ACLQBD_04335 [Syntrophobacteraceae bacterium]
MTSLFDLSGRGTPLKNPGYYVKVFGVTNPKQGDPVPSLGFPKII